MFAWLVLLLVILVLALSVWQRIRYFRKTIDENNLKASPLSLAIQELISISGGIYLSLLMLVSFLKLNVPETIILFEFSIDPLAFSAIGLAIIQPVFLTLYHGIKKNFPI
ncbi:hypothetical protein [Pelosinus sp. sgz500959]|uniref:hypothetical protein n=1 Tax=Pelosinus sp. sgz500959 TaxID=3242472 RepID=UPI0036729065